ncbi:hypothetical protein DFR50_1599 [Roseiarcus fermentans]|uniref:Uncharacterized protein n=1 Tax=Roseiarcus fermentans TaxID=1473586 RepID=A0A366EF80_9HYPH|nr:hypothetical protein [Roseiarcus fermentans]RBP01064.1 hypothetical protein DFR50_1599 [Roseiarcus fermentans]
MAKKQPTAAPLAADAPRIKLPSELLAARRGPNPRAAAFSATRPGAETPIDAARAEAAGRMAAALASHPDAQEPSENVVSWLRERLAFVEQERADLFQRVKEAEASAIFWRDAADASKAMEARYKSTILGLSHQLADLKLAEADVDADRGV